MTLGEMLKQKRMAIGLTLQEVGDAAGLTKGHVHELESGKQFNPGIFTCARLAIVLGLTVQAMAAAAMESQSKKET